MAKKKLGMASIEVNKKFKDEEEAFKYAKRLKEHISYMCKKNANNGWYASAMIVVSNIKKNASSLEIVNNGNAGGQRKELVINDFMNDRWYKGNYKTDWHLHILLVSCPSYAFREDIKKYIDKNWINIDNIREKQEFDISQLKKGKVYKKNCNIKLADYFIEQSSKRLFCNFNFGNENGLEYSLKQYYSEYMKLKNNKIKLYRDNINKPMAEEKYLNRLDRIEKRFNEVNDYFYNINIDAELKKEKSYMEKARLNKIADNYENIEIDNKVQENRNRRMNDYSVF